MHIQSRHREIYAETHAGTSSAYSSPAPWCLAAVTRRHSAWADLRRLPLHSPIGRMVSTWGQVSTRSGLSAPRGSAVLRGVDATRARRRSSNLALRHAL